MKSCSIDLEELKTKFQNKAVADLKDVGLVLRATPFLVREVLRLEEALCEAESRIQHLSGMLKRNPPLERTGRRGQSAWKIWVDDRKNRLYIQLFGKVEKDSGKLISNAVASVMDNLRSGFSIVVDLRRMLSVIDARTLFYFRKTVYTFMQMEAALLVRVMEEEQDFSFLMDNLENNGLLIQKNSSAYRVRSIQEADYLIDNIGRHLKA